MRVPTVKRFASLLVCGLCLGIATLPAVGIPRRAVFPAAARHADWQATLADLQQAVAAGNRPLVRRLWLKLRQELRLLPPGRDASRARLQVARTLLNLSAGSASSRQPEALPQIAQFLEKTLNRARAQGDLQLESAALGFLGKVYERDGQTDRARTATQQALDLARATQSPRLEFFWTWQQARLLARQGQSEAALVAYRQALTLLQSNRQRLARLPPAERLSWRQEIEPAYQQMLGLLLAVGGGGRLQEARDVLEALRLEELASFLGPELVGAKTARLPAIDEGAAIVYPVVLPDRLLVLAKLPGQPLRAYPQAVAPERVTATLAALRAGLLDPRSQAYLDPAQQLYDWLVRPLLGDLAASSADTLVFIPHGDLQNLPIAALHSGNRFLVEDYALALAPALQLVDPQPLAAVGELSAVLGGLSEARQGFSPLPGVALEVERLQALLARSQVLFNDSFSRDRLAEALTRTPFPIVHLATHGQFGSTPEETFLLVWDERLDLDELTELLQGSLAARREPVELLVLSACQTAVGDDRAALGLAGTAIRAGARSTVATLWAVSDEGTTFLMERFYRGLLEESQPRAGALQSAQMAAIASPEYGHPFFWAPFVLMGSWL